MSDPIIWNNPELHQHEPRMMPKVCPSCRLAWHMMWLFLASAGVVVIFGLFLVWAIVQGIRL